MENINEFEFIYTCDCGYDKLLTKDNRCPECKVILDWTDEQ